MDTEFIPRMIVPGLAYFFCIIPHLAGDVKAGMFRLYEAFKVMIASNLGFDRSHLFPLHKHYEYARRNYRSLQAHGFCCETLLFQFSPTKLADFRNL